MLTLAQTADFWVGLLRDFGPFVCLIAYMLWRDGKREQKMQDVIDSMASFQRETLMSIATDSKVQVEKSTSAIENNSTALTQHSAALTENTAAIREQLVILRGPGGAAHPPH